MSVVATELVCKLSNISKRFGTVDALESVSFDLKAGEIHAVVGENGAGKSTLMKVLYGLYKNDSGSVEVFGKERNFTSSRDAIQAGVGMVGQHYAIIPDLSCIQNLLLGAEPSAIIDVPAAIKRAQELAGQMDFSFEWNRPAFELGPASAQKLEILKLLWREARIMVLDEPTAMLPPEDAELLYASLKKLVKQGKSVIVVTHRIKEVIHHCDRVTVLRGGKFVASEVVTPELEDRLPELMVGKKIATNVKTHFEVGPVRLQIGGLTVKGDRGDEAVKNASLTLHEGEIVGIAGVDGSGQKELFQAILGVREHPASTIVFNKAPLNNVDTEERIRRGIRIIAEDRHTESIMSQWSLRDNAVLGFHNFKRLRKGFGINRVEQQELTQQFIDQFNTKCSSANQAIGSLSGGNQQRFVAARALGLQPQLILAFQPTRGLDIQGRKAVYDGIREATRTGACALVVAFDLEELEEFCDRIVVMCAGKLTVPETMDRAEIGRLMVGE